MFKSTELKFNSSEHKFNSFELKFSTFEHRFLLRINTFSKDKYFCQALPYHVFFYDFA